MTGVATASSELRSAVDSVVAWYHTIELPGGIVTPGWFDLRPVVERLPWPDVRGKRCLDVGTYDGFLAFELERRGAAQVTAVDVADPREWDWPADARTHGPTLASAMSGATRGEGFRVAREALGSSVERIELNAYDLSPERVGHFDVVVCGSLLLHLRDPVRALEAMRSVCDGQLLSAEPIRLGLSYLLRRRPLAVLDGSGEMVQWWTPNAAGHRRMLFAAGFEVERTSRPYSVRFGASYPAERRSLLARRLGGLRDDLLQRALTGGVGVPHSAALCRPRELSRGESQA